MTQSVTAGDGLEPVADRILLRPFPPFTPGPSPIVGEVYEVHFDRRTFILQLDDGPLVCTFMYLYRRDEGWPVIASGDWLNR